MYHDTGYTSRADRVIVQVSTDGGTTWSDVGAPINRYDGTTGWAKHTVSLNAYVGMPAVRVGLLGISDYGNDVHIDDVSLTSLRCSQYAFPPDAHVIVKDQWADTAPRTDIDTVVLGPTDSGLADAEFGMWAGDFTDSSYYGPYTLDTVAKSPVVRSGQATWQFNTSSGANEDWVAFPIEDGLHELLQHNVLFEGDKFDVVFTKTVGLLTESVHDFAIDTYVDSGTVGQVALESTIGLNGLTASAYLNGVAETTFPNEPLGFTGAGTIEWTYVFTVTDGTSIEATTTSGNIPDIDLYLYRWTGSTYQQVSSSAGSTASEHVLFLNPPDGRYLIGIDNYSGPAGTFNLDLLVKYRVPGLSVTGATASPIPANTPVTLTINFNYPLQPGVTYDGVVLAGPPEAPQLKQIPVAITRLENSAYIEKKVNHDVAFPGDELRYTIDLFNISDAAADVQRVPGDPSTLPLLQRCVAGAASADEARHLGELWQSRVRRLLLGHAEDDEVFRVRRVAPADRVGGRAA